MEANHRFDSQQLHYLQLLAQRYPTIQAAATEIIRLQAVLQMPKPTEHFMSDIHGEHEAFLHILNSCSGEVKETINAVFGDTMTQPDKNELATLIYYPAPKLALELDKNKEINQWYHAALNRLVPLFRNVSMKHPRSKVRSELPGAHAQIIDELVRLWDMGGAGHSLFTHLIDRIVEIGQAPGMIEALCGIIKTLICDRMHIVGDLFDRGPRADIVMDSLMTYPNVDIQWGNHDILWMGAACGSRTLVAHVLANSIRYNNLDVLESGYGISLRPLSVFANEVYKNTDLACFRVKLVGANPSDYSEQDLLQSARMHKAICIIMFKLEGQLMLRHPEYGMHDRLLLDKVDYQTGIIRFDGKECVMKDWDFPTVDPNDPYTLTPEESQVIDQLTDAFCHSEKLQKHIQFLYSKGSLYKVTNGNLLFHGCIPMNEDGSYITFNMDGVPRSGKAFLDYAEQTARAAYAFPRESRERKQATDFIWWLWTGRNSPIFAQDRLTTFERQLLSDESTWPEPRNAYYVHVQKQAVCERILRDFGLEGAHCHIINGHVPVKVKKGESPIKGGGKLLVIDGGFSRAYQPTSGIAGYTLIFSSQDFRMVTHHPFSSRYGAIHHNDDIASDCLIFERMDHRMTVSETDEGRLLQTQVGELKDLLLAYRSGAISEKH